MLSAVMYVCSQPRLIFAQVGDNMEVSGSGLSVSPALIELTLDPGESRDKEFYVNNITKTPVPLNIGTQPLYPNEQIIDDTKTDSFDAAQWVSVDEPDNILNAGEQRQLTAKISVPESAEPGGHYATIVLEPLVPATEMSSGASIASRVGILVFITVSGDAIYDVELQEPSVGRLQWSRHVPITAEFLNQGTIHISPTTRVTVKNIFGDTLGEVPVQPRVVLPNTQKILRAQWRSPSLIGIYSAQIEASYGEDGTVLESGQRYFLVVQWLPVLGIVILASILGWLIKVGQRLPAACKAFRG